MSKHAKDVQGLALYLEFRRTHSTVQILITPDGLTNNGDGATSSQFFRRQMSLGISKRKWRSYTLRFTAGQKDALLREEVISDETVKSDTFGKFMNLYDYFANLNSQGYKLVKDQPIYVEVTKDDLTAARDGNLSTKLWSRVKSSRIAYGFPEEVVDTGTTL